MRYFLAFPVSDYLRQKVAEILKVFKPLDVDVKWAELVNLHLTLEFFEDLEENRLKDTIFQVNDLVGGFSVIETQLTEIGAFPDLNHPKVIWLGLKDPNSQMAAIAKALGNAKFEPHITLGRVKSGKNVKKLVEAIGLFESGNKEVERFTKIVLYKSTLTVQGSIYEAVKEFNLSTKKD